MILRIELLPSFTTLAKTTVRFRVDNFLAVMNINRSPERDSFVSTSITNRIDCGCAGENRVVWFGPWAAVSITDPELIKEIMSKNYVFQKASGNPMRKMLARGVATYETEKWAKHRKLINPAFHLQKLKVHD